MAGYGLELDVKALQEAYMRIWKSKWDFRSSIRHMEFQRQFKILENAAKEMLKQIEADKENNLAKGTKDEIY